MGARRNMPKSALRIDKGWNAMPPNYYPNLPVRVNPFNGSLVEGMKTFKDLMLPIICLVLTGSYHYAVQEILDALRLGEDECEADWKRVLTCPQSGETFCLWTAEYDIPRSGKRGRATTPEMVGLPRDQLHRLAPLLFSDIVR
jgi:hypothetical protein